MTSCGAPDQAAVTLTSGEEIGIVAGATVVDGQVQRDGEAVAGAFVRLLDATGEFVAEVVSGPQGQFRFHAAPGVWTVRALAPGARGARTIEAAAGRNRVDVPLAEHAG